MAATDTLSHQFPVPQISKLGVYTAHGFNIRIAVRNRHLEIEDGIGPYRRKLRLPRVGHRLRRLVCIGEDGYISLSALKWLSDIKASFAMIDRLGKVRIVTGPTSPSEARLRRAQALAVSNGTALPIARELIAAKLSGQEALARDKLNDIQTADLIGKLRVNLSAADTLDTVRQIESRAASEYWDAWREVPVRFPRNDEKRVPSHWLRFGTRHSPLTGGPRLAVNVGNALVNYTNAIAASECRLAVVACGLDPGLGFIHKDTANRDSLVLDIFETIRPAIEAWLLDWLLTEPLRRSDFLECSDGNCRISSALCSRLSETAPVWGRLVAPWVEFVARSLWGGRASTALFPGEFKTPLTQDHRREAKGASAPTVKLPNRERVCRTCGGPVRDGEHCSACARELLRTTMIERAKNGRVAAQTADAQQKRSETQLRHKAAQKQWRLGPKGDQISEETYRKEVQPRLSSIKITAIATLLGVSVPYAADIRAGRRRPHRRHWEALATCAGTVCEITGS